MAKSQNGWPVLASKGTRKWIIPGTNRHLIMQDGDAGFVLAHLALWFNDRVEKIGEGVFDEWGWAVRDIRNSTTISNHASGTAMDLNATKHPLGKVNTFTPKMTKRIRKRLQRAYPVVRWGGDYKGRKDEMHFEIVGSVKEVAPVAKKLRKSYRGKKITKAN